MDSSILLVEDNANDARLITFTLRAAGIENPVHTVVTVDEAIAHLESLRGSDTNPLPHVILLDLSLPGKSGHDLLRWMKPQPWLSTVVRVVVTGSESDADLAMSYKLGANAYLRKPLTVDQLTGPSRNLRSLLAGRVEGLTAPA